MLSHVKLATALLEWLLAYWNAVARVFGVIARERLLCSGWLLSAYVVVIIIYMIYSSYSVIQDLISVDVSGVFFFFAVSGENYKVAVYYLQCAIGII